MLFCFFLKQETKNSHEGCFLYQEKRNTDQGGVVVGKGHANNLISLASRDKSDISQDCFLLLILRQRYLTLIIFEFLFTFEVSDYIKFKFSRLLPVNYLVYFLNCMGDEQELCFQKKDWKLFFCSF